MQKKLIALAIAGLASSAAFAQSNVTISGTIRAGVESAKRSDISNEVRVTDQSSEIAFSGVEDLGGGLKAWFRMASRFSIDEGNGTSARNIGISGLALGNSGVGLEGSFGKITLGRWDLHYNQAAGYENSKVFSLQGLIGHGVMSQVNGTTIARGTRSDNVLMYDTPNMSGFVGTLAWSANPGGMEGTCGAAAPGAAAAATAMPGTGLLPGAATGSPGCANTNPSKNGAVNLRVAYANGPVTAGYSYWAWDAEGGAAGSVDQRGDTLGGRYAFGNGFKLGLVWNKSRLSTNGGTEVHRSAWMLPIGFETGAHNVTFTYAKANQLSGSGVAAANDTAAKVVKLGYDYTMSKRTALGVSYIKLDNNTNATYALFNTGFASVSGSSAPGGATAGTDQRQWYVGVNHNF